MVEVPIPREKWTGKIGVLELGSSSEKGGSRGKKVLVGGSNGMPFLSYEGISPNRQVIAGEVVDVATDLPKAVKEFFGDAINDPVQMAKIWSRSTTPTSSASSFCRRTRKRRTSPRRRPPRP